jgi:hypothetical protein
MKETKDRNPYHLCTLDPNSACDTCENLNVLDCKLDRRQTIVTTLVIYSFIVVSTLGLYLVGRITDMWWMLVVFVVFFVLFFIVIEPRITCSHCPYYAEKRFRFNCPGNMLTPKMWRYHPEPMNKYERLGTLIGFIFFGAFPVFSELYGAYFLFAEGHGFMDVLVLELLVILVATILFIAILYAIFLLVFCQKCVNFSCQFNKVPKPVVDRYLKANLVLKEAWEKSGYKF